MRGYLATALAASATALGVAPGAAQADPSSPQVNPAPAHREDAQRLREQLRALEREAAPSSATGNAAALPGEPSGGAARTSYAGGALLIVSGLCAATTLALFAATPGSGETSSYDTAKLLFGVTTAVTGVTGLILWSKSRSVQVAPAVTARAVGVSLIGRL